MPIRPEMRARYPKDWKAIRARILERAGSACECTGQCGADHFDSEGRCSAPNGKAIRRLLSFGFVWMLATERAGWTDAVAKGYGFGPPIRVVLTIAHLVDKNPEACDDGNLAALCQRCHLKLDLLDHQRQAAETRAAKRHEGQRRLF